MVRGSSGLGGCSSCSLASSPAAAAAATIDDDDDNVVAVPAVAVFSFVLEAVDIALLLVELAGWVVLARSVATAAGGKASLLLLLLVLLLRLLLPPPLAPPRPYHTSSLRLSASANTELVMACIGVRATTEGYDIISCCSHSIKSNPMDENPENILVRVMNRRLCRHLSPFCVISCPPNTVGELIVGSFDLL